MFLGEYTHSIDDKGRLTIPARFRGELAAGLVVTCGFDTSLVVYPIEEWVKVAEKVAAQPLSSESARSLRRRVFSLAADLEPDRQGRILLPQKLREFADIDGDAIIVGMFNHVEIWDKDRWQAVRANDIRDGENEKWSDLGI